MFTPGAVCHTPISRFGSGNGKALISTLLITLKMAVLAPIPKASVIIVASVNRGVRARRRNVCFKSRIISGKSHSSRILDERSSSSRRSFIFVDQFLWEGTMIRPSMFPNGSHCSVRPSPNYRNQEFCNYLGNRLGVEIAAIVNPELIRRHAASHTFGGIRVE